MVEREGTCINGRPEGELRIYNAQGKLTILSNFQNGKPNGTTFYYGKDSKFMASEVYKNGVFKKGAKLKIED